MDEQRDRSEGEDEGILTGTASEQAPGVGGLGDHPAPAAVRDPDGSIHVAGEPPAGTIAGSVAPDDLGETAGGDVTDPEAQERLNAVVDHAAHPTDRPDIGTE